MRKLPGLLILLSLLGGSSIASARYHHDSEAVAFQRVNAGYKFVALESDRGLILADHEDDNNDGREIESKRSKRWEDLSPRQQRKLERRYEEYKSLPQVEQERIKDARQKYRDLPPEKRRELRDQYRKSKRRQARDQ